MLKQDFCWFVVNPNLFETLPEFCQGPDLGIEDNSLLALHPQDPLLYSLRRQ